MKFKYIVLILLFQGALFYAQEESFSSTLQRSYRVIISSDFPPLDVEQLISTRIDAYLNIT